MQASGLAEFIPFICTSGLPLGSVVNNLPAMQEPQETQVQLLGGEDPLEEGMAAHSSLLAQRVPGTEEPGGLQSTGSQKVRHNQMSPSVPGKPDFPALPRLSSRGSTHPKALIHIPFN